MKEIGGNGIAKETGDQEGVGRIIGGHAASPAHVHDGIKRDHPQ